MREEVLVQRFADGFFLAQAVGCKKVISKRKSILRLGYRCTETLLEFFP